MRFRLAGIALIAIGALAPVAPAQAASTTYSCPVTLGTSANLYISLGTVNVGSCKLAAGIESSVVTALDTPDGCKVWSAPGPGQPPDTVLTVGTRLPPGDDLWGRCSVGGLSVGITLDPQPAPVTASILRIDPFVTTAADGTVLRGHVYIPTGTGRHATVLEMSPYWNTTYGLSDNQAQQINGQNTMKLWLRPFLEAGFAVALVNIRGTGLSDGCMQWGTRVDWDDAKTVVNAVAALPGSNGKVGMFGLSWDAWTQFMALADKPPAALKAVVPASPVIDYYRLVTRNGARPYADPATSNLWTAGTAGAAYGIVDAFIYGPFIPVTSANHLACPRYLEDEQAHAQLARDGEKTAYFQARDLRPHVVGTKIPVLAANGFISPEDCCITQYDDLWDSLKGDRRYMFGQWDHVLPTDSRFLSMAVDWFDHYLRGGKKKVATNVVDYQDDTGAWHTANHWPPPASQTGLFLSDAGTLVPIAAAAHPTPVTFQTTPTSYIGFCNTPDWARYVSGPVAQDTLVAGSFSAKVTLTSDKPEGNLAVTVYEVSGDGTCGQSQKEISRALTTLRQWSNPGYGRDFPLGTPTTVTIKSLPFARVIHAGSHLAVTVGGSSEDLLLGTDYPQLTVSGGSVTMPVVSGGLN